MSNLAVISDNELAIVAAEAGAQVVRGRFGTPLTRTGKGGLDFATDVDVAAEKAIIDLLLAHRPTDRIVAEEVGEIGNPGTERCWLVDPLCGTLNFAAGTGPMGVNVALRDGDTVTAAAVADPFAEVVDWTDGSVARRRMNGEDQPLEPSPLSQLVDLNMDAAPGKHGQMTTLRLLADEDFVARFAPRVMSTSLALAWVASGRRAGYITDGTLEGSVHFTAATALCIAAGCNVTNLAGGPLHTEPGGLIAAADSTTHQTLVAITAGHLPSSS